MTFQEQFDRIAGFWQTLECLCPAGRRDAVVNEVIETGGTYLLPDGRGRSSHMFELSLHGVVAFGADEDEAIRNWLIAARALIGLR